MEEGDAAGEGGGGVALADLAAKQIKKKIIEKLL